MKRNYRNKMTDTYSDIYQDQYSLNNKVLNYTTKIIKKNLLEMGISLQELKKMKVLNIGTGIETVTFRKLGAKKVYHFDISQKAVNAVKKHNKKYKNIISQRIDVCNEKIRLNEKVDVIYLCGVFHHFNKPKLGLQNLLNNLNYKGIIFIRNYTSGSMFFFLVDFIRKFVPKLDVKIIQKLLLERLEKKFGKFKTDNKYWINNYSNYLYNTSVDNCCVPTVNLFDANKFQKYFVKNNFKNLLVKKYPIYNHNDHRKIDVMMQSFIFKNLNQKKIKLKKKFLNHVDQLNIKYKEKHIVDTVKLMKIKLNKILKLNIVNKIDLLIDLQFIGNSFRYSKFYKTPNSFFFKNNQKKLSNAKGIHQLLKERLKLEI